MNIYICVIYEYIYIYVCDIWIYIYMCVIYEYIYMWYMNIYICDIWIYIYMCVIYEYIYICDMWIYIYVCDIWIYICDIWIYIYMWYMNIYICDNSYIYNDKWWLFDSDYLRVEAPYCSIYWGLSPFMNSKVLLTQPVFKEWQFGFSTLISWVTFLPRPICSMYGTYPLVLKHGWEIPELNAAFKRYKDQL